MEFKPLKFAVPLQHATNCANKPTGSWSSSWFDINQCLLKHEDEKKNSNENAIIIYQNARFH